MKFYERFDQEGPSLSPGLGIVGIRVEEECEVKFDLMLSNNSI